MFAGSSEALRAEALNELDILDTVPELVFDQLTSLAASILSMPICLISLLDENRQWFKSRTGLEIQSTPRNIAFCNHTIRDRSVLIVPDAVSDDRFKDNPLVTCEPHIRFYAGAPILHKGINIGAFCVIDHVANSAFGDAQAIILKQFADITTEILDLRKDTTLGAKRQLYID